MDAASYPVTGSRIAVHFAPGILSRIGTSDLQAWGDVLRAWHHDGDPSKTFGRDAANGPISYSRHLHMVPSGDDAKWLKARKSYDRTSDRLLIYSLDRSAPMKFGMYCIDLLGDPDGHKLAFTGPSAAERREIWEGLAWSHQNGQFSADHTSHSQPSIKRGR